MANVNISSIVLTDTFNDWVARSNVLIDTTNLLRNGNYFKDGGALTSNADVTLTDNASMVLNKLTGTVLTSAGNVVFSKGLTLGTIGNVQSAIANSGNTTTVSANSGSVRVANGLNFVNTSTITVSVVGGTGSNANISFGVVGGAAQGIQGTTGTGAQGLTGTQGTTGTSIQGTSGISVQGTQGTSGAVNVKVGVIGELAAYDTTTSVDGINSVTHTGGTLSVSSNVQFTSNIVDTPVISITADTTISDNYAGKVLLVTSTAPTRINITTANSASLSGFAVTIVRMGTGNVTIANQTLKVNSTSFTTSNISTRYEAATVVYTATNQILVLGSIL